MSDIALSNDLRKRKKNCILVVNKGYKVPHEVKSDYNCVVTTHPCIETYRKVYADDLSQRLGLGKNTLSPAFAISTLLNPMFGRKPNIIGAKLMTEEQYERSRRSIVRLIKDEMERDVPVTDVDLLEVETSNHSKDGDCEIVDDYIHQRAEEELKQFELFKMWKFIPELKYERMIVGTNGTEGGGNFEIGVGPVVKRGQNLPSNKNLADYIDKKGRMNLLDFFSDHEQRFPTLFKIMQREASRRAVEVGCERFFGLSGYVSQPRRSTLGVRNYERLAMLATILQSLFIDPSWVAEEYLRRSKAGKWK
jgi:hypothetical protein